MLNDIIWAIGRTKPWFRKFVYRVSKRYYWGIIGFIKDFGNTDGKQITARELDEAIAYLFPPKE